MSSSDIPHLPPMNVIDLRASGAVALPPARATGNSINTSASVDSNSASTRTNARFGDITPLPSGDIGIEGVVERKLVFPTKTTIREDRYVVLRTLLAAEVKRRKIHTIVHQKERAKAWAVFYSETIGDTGIMRKFVHYEGSTPEHQIFRRMVNAGLDHDAKLYSTRGPDGEGEPSELEILSSIIITERDAAELQHKASNDAKKAKKDKERSENEAAEVELGLRREDVEIVSPATTALLGGNPVSVLASRGSDGGEICTWIKISHVTLFSQALLYLISQPLLQ